MSQSSTTSAFTPITHHNGGKESYTKLDKAVASVSNLQSNADLLKHAVSVVDDVVSTLDKFTFRGKRDVFDKLNGLKCTLASVRKTIEHSAVSLSPIPSLANNIFLVSNKTSF